MRRQSSSQSRFTPRLYWEGVKTVGALVALLLAPGVERVAEPGAPGKDGGDIQTPPRLAASISCEEAAEDREPEDAAAEDRVPEWD